jgi:hypothetical protein
MKNNLLKKRLLKAILNLKICKTALIESKLTLKEMQRHLLLLGKDKTIA